jgi:uncharacterized integral membrane protein (TIGR00698 family)
MINVMKSQITNARQSIQVPEWLPGFMLLFIIAFIAKELGESFPLLGGVVIAILLGALIRNFFNVRPIYESGIQFTLKKVLKFAIILLGTSLNFLEVARIGANSIAVILAVVILGIFITVGIGKLLKIDSSLGLLIGIGTSICGATAITATKSVIDTKEIQTAYAITTIFLFNLLATFLYPWIAVWFEMSETLFGIWVGTAVHDTSSVVAIGYMYGLEAGETATTVKLVRTLFLLPLMIFLSIWAQRKATVKMESSSLRGKIKKIVPWFILGFIAMSVLNSFGVFPTGVVEGSVKLAKFLIIMVMVGVGLQVDWKKLMALGPKPLLTGLFASVFVSIVSLVMILILGVK